MRRLLLLLLTPLYLIGEEGCSIYKKSVSNELDKQVDVKPSESKTKAKFLKVTPTLEMVSILHEGEEVVIKRKVQEGLTECPPFCIQPISIEGVRSVGEVETLEFLKNLKEKKVRLLLDVREHIAYQEATIPGAINLPLSMLDKKSPYYEKVLTLLGAKKKAQSWYFKNVHILLVFGTSAMHNEASTMVKRLIKLGYPKEKILYYRGGIESWRRSGLTTY